MKKTVQLAAVALVMLAVGAAIGGYVTTSLTPQRVDLLKRVKDRGYIIVGTSADYPPFESVDPTTKKIVGLDVDIVEAVAKEMGVSVRWEDMPFDSLIAAAETGKIDMIAAAMGLKAERIPKLDYSIYYELGDNVLVVKTESTVMTFTDLAEAGTLNLKIGVQSGTIQESIINDLVTAGKIKKENVVSYQRVDLMIQDMVAGRIDAALIDKPVADSFSKRYSIRIVYTEWAPPKCLWLPKGQRELLDAVDTALLKLHKSGLIQQLIDQWLG